MSLKITIPKPCHENWAAMSPDDKGRFCAQCAKTVVDFTAMPQAEVEGYLLANADKKVCGRFYSSQLHDAPVTLHIPREALFRQTSFRNIFLLALLVSMGTTLFSCQNRTIGEVAVDDDTTQVDTTPALTGDTIATVIDTVSGARLNNLKPIPCKGILPKGTVVGMVIPEPPEPQMIGDIAIMPDTAYVEKDIYSPGEVHSTPQYPGGITKLYEYIYSNLKIPESIEGEIRRMYVSFVIEKDGSLGTIKVLRGFDNSLNAQVIDILKKSPKWVPAQIDKENVRVQFSLPITIKPTE